MAIVQSTVSKYYGKNLEAGDDSFVRNVYVQGDILALEVNFLIFLYESIIRNGGKLPERKKLPLFPALVVPSHPGSDSLSSYLKYVYCICLPPKEYLKIPYQGQILGCSTGLPQKWALTKVATTLLLGYVIDT